MAREPAFPSPLRIGVLVRAGRGEAALGVGGVGWGAVASADDGGAIVAGSGPGVAVGVWVVGAWFVVGSCQRNCPVGACSRVGKRVRRVVRIRV